ncbi:Meiosis-specific protein ASY1 [Camellia lanceoleosa]|nr:Meiosis-specific protein ASY1 [Camellia lanceoleosa]
MCYHMNTWNNMKELHSSINLSWRALVSADPTVTLLGSYSQAHVFSSKSGDCAAFLSNYHLDNFKDYGVDKYDLGTGFGHFAIATPDNWSIKGWKNVIAFAKDHDVYLFELIQRGPTPEPLCQVMLRVGDLDRSIKFYEKPVDYEHPFFRSCTEQEAHNPWTKNPLKMEVGYVNSKHFVLALKVKSVLDPCEDENYDIQDDDVSLGADSVERDEHYESAHKCLVNYLSICNPLEVSHYKKSEYIVAPIDKQQNCDDNGMVDEDDLEDPVEDEHQLGRESAYKFNAVKEEMDVPDGKKAQQGMGEDHMYMKDLDINESHNKSNHVEFQKIGINRDMSTCGMLHSVGSDLTSTRGGSETHQNGSLRSEQNGSRARDHGNAPTSRAEVSLSDHELLPFYL